MSGTQARAPAPASKPAVVRTRSSLTRPAFGPRSFVAAPWRHRGLIWQLARREVVGRYQGSLLGLTWSFFNPLLMLLVYTLFFTQALGATWVEPGESKASFATALFMGLIVHGFFAECAMRAPRLVTGNVSYVKKIVFPLEILPWVSTSSAFFHALASLVVFLVFVLAVNGSIEPTFPLIVLVLVPLVLVSTAVGWLFSALGVYLRDIGQMVGVLVTAMLFTAPVFFPSGRLSGTALGVLVTLNPLTFLINQAREVALWGHLPDFGGLALYTACATLAAWLAYAWFQKSRMGFADVI